MYQINWKCWGLWHFIPAHKSGSEPWQITHRSSFNSIIPIEALSPHLQSCIQVLQRQPQGLVDRASGREDGVQSFQQSHPGGAALLLLNLPALESRHMWGWGCRAKRGESGAWLPGLPPQDQDQDPRQLPTRPAARRPSLHSRWCWAPACRCASPRWSQRPLRPIFLV